MNNQYSNSYHAPPWPFARSTTDQRLQQTWGPNPTPSPRPTPTPTPGPRPTPTPGPRPGGEYVTIDDVKSYFMNKNFNADGSPQGGFLLSMVDMPSLCGDYNWTNLANKQCFTNAAKDCSHILNIADINAWLSTIGPGGNTNCYNIATTYWRIGMPKYVFGPYKGTDMNIGILIDVTKIFDYIACAYPLDSGTIARYNNYCAGSTFDTDAFRSCNIEPLSPLLNVQSNGDLCSSNAAGAACYPNFNTANFIGAPGTDKKQKWQNWLKTEESKNLGQAGCGLSSSGRNAGLIQHSVSRASDFIRVSPAHATAQLNRINNLAPGDLPATFSNGSWSTTNENMPFDKYNWELWTKAVNNLYDKAVGLGPTFVDSQYYPGDGYRENEVDIVVPNKSRSNTDRHEFPCQVTAEFEAVFINSIMGVVSFAQNNCSNSPGNERGGPGGFGCVSGTDNCNFDNDRSLPNAVRDREQNCVSTDNGQTCNSTFIDPVLCLQNNPKKNCYSQADSQAYCYESQVVPGLECCCSQEFTESLVQELVKKFNNSSQRRSAGAKKIHGYKIDDISNVYNFAKVSATKPLNITQLT